MKIFLLAAAYFCNQGIFSLFPGSLSCNQFTGARFRHKKFEVKIFYFDFLLATNDSPAEDFSLQKTAASCIINLSEKGKPGTPPQTRIRPSGVDRFCRGHRNPLWRKGWSLVFLKKWNDVHVRKCRKWQKSIRVDQNAILRACPTRAPGHRVACTLLPFTVLKLLSYNL